MRIPSVFRWAVALLLAFFAIEKLRLHWADQSAQGRMAAPPAAFGESPEQTASKDPPFALRGYQIRPLANFALRARVLSRENYRWDKGAELSRLDLALGWKRMADPAVYEALDISQGWRWYHYAARDEPPIPWGEIIESSANMHMIAANPAVERVLEKARKGGYIRIAGKLVEVTDPNGWRWTSSLSRTDTGAHACELVFVEYVQVEN